MTTATAVRMSPRWWFSSSLSSHYFSSRPFHDFILHNILTRSSSYSSSYNTTSNNSTIVTSDFTSRFLKNSLWKWSNWNVPPLYFWWGCRIQNWIGNLNLDRDDFGRSRRSTGSTSYVISVDSEVEDFMEQSADIGGVWFSSTLKKRKKKMNKHKLQKRRKRERARAGKKNA